MLYQSTVFASFPGLVAAQSTRHGGVSSAPYYSLNLGKSTDDDPDHVAENRRRFCAALGFRPEQLALSRQVHGDRIQVVSAPGLSEGFDALVTDQPGILLGVSVADCTPTLIFYQKNKAIAAIHAGWKGTAAGIVAKTLNFMAEQFGSIGANCRAYVGTCIDECSFEVGDEVATVFADHFKRFDADKGKFFVDLKKANTAQLLAFGIPADQIEISPYSTVLHNEDYFSHRQEKGITGRMLAVIGLLEDRPGTSRPAMGY
jgi:YfiH family protein